MAFRTYDVDTLLEFMEKLDLEPPLPYQLRHLIAQDLGIPAKNVFVEKRQGNWLAMVRLSPKESITITFDRPAPEEEDDA